MVQLLRFVGEANSGRTTNALNWAFALSSNDHRSVFVMDTLGHGPSSLYSLAPEGLSARLMYGFCNEGYELARVARGLVASGDLACLMIDDVAGLTFAGREDYGRGREVQRVVNGLASLCLSARTHLILVDRVSPYQCRAPLGFRDIHACFEASAN